MEDGFPFANPIDWETELIITILTGQACQQGVERLPFVENGQFPAVRVMPDPDYCLGAMLDGFALHAAWGSVANAEHQGRSSP